MQNRIFAYIGHGHPPAHAAHALRRSPAALSGRDVRCAAAGERLLQPAPSERPLLLVLPRLRGRGGWDGTALLEVCRTGRRSGRDAARRVLRASQDRVSRAARPRASSAHPRSSRAAARRRRCDGGFVEERLLPPARRPRRNDRVSDLCGSAGRPPAGGASRDQRPRCGAVPFDIDAGRGQHAADPRRAARRRRDLPGGASPGRFVRRRRLRQRAAVPGRVPDSQPHRGRRDRGRLAHAGTRWRVGTAPPLPRFPDLSARPLGAAAQGGRAGDGAGARPLRHPQTHRRDAPPRRSGQCRQGPQGCASGRGSDRGARPRVASGFPRGCLDRTCGPAAPGFLRRSANVWTRRWRGSAPRRGFRPRPMASAAPPCRSGVPAAARPG